MIIEMVIGQGKKVKEAAHRCKVNLSSAKNVVAIYKREGRIKKKKNRAHAIALPIVRIMNPSQLHNHTMRLNPSWNAQ